MLNRQCMGERVGEKGERIEKADAWERTRNDTTARIGGQFTTADARIKRRRLCAKR